MPDPTALAFDAGIVAAVTAVLHGLKWVAPYLLPSIFSRPAIQPTPPAPLVAAGGHTGECTGCASLRTEMGLARDELRVATRALDALTIRAEEREKVRLERLQEQALMGRKT